MVMGSEGVNGVEGGSAGADPVTERIRDGEGDGGGRDSAHPLGAVELPFVKLGLLGASGRQDDGVPSGNPRRVPD